MTSASVFPDSPSRLPARGLWRLVLEGVCLWGTLLALCLAPGLAKGDELARFESTQIEMGVPFKIILYAPDKTAAKGAMAAAFSRIGELNRILSDYDPHSELSRLSATGPSPKPVPVSDDLWTVLAASQELAQKTNGAFDVTVGPYVRLWRRARRQKEMPSPERLAEARAAVGHQLMKLDGKQRSVQLLKPGMRLDLGGIAMGHAVDEVLELLRKRGISRAMVDASGDVGVSGPPPGKRGWTIGIVPLSDEGTPTRYIELAHAAVTTAGDAVQFVEIDGKRYSHIVDPRTGLGMTDHNGVAVIAPTCMAADSLDTALSVMGPEAGLALIEATPGTAAFFVRDTNGKVETFESSRFAEFLSDPQPAALAAPEVKP